MIGVNENISHNVIKNARAIAKAKGLSIGDLEVELGLSAGYLSRCGKPEAKRRLSIDTAYRLAMYFDLEDDTTICDFFFRDMSLDYEIEGIEADILALKDELFTKEHILEKMLEERRNLL